MTIDIHMIRDRLPREIADLESAARQEGYRHITRLVDEWAAGDIRFERDGERLLSAYVGEALAGIGGMTVQGAMSGALRMRRFYISPAMRRRGIGRMLAPALLEHARSSCSIVTVHAGNDGAAKFWESLGFPANGRDGHTHRLDLHGSSLTPRSP
ncbi:GNAT superfamily N-acetyltransferase [Rhizobium leguminosarum]|uniref:GNAT superfamily N-acetyltransferase n=1 Tax=Rhizobium leguminosarum TaxID=384 RepID=A0AAE2MM11_RHILE|nr:MULTISPECIES: GNAT family N-acetyltransferase [Rhizobium]MBB4291857.1 GNAT superfamily N-acetyltransferase [Rhizobium leguminosarum]MBB4298458.1 GNAT superfamily N-acetyltransferase [Rhizobium leguminosarum]MBB4309596.1 GNAT superfamily N-acetyltransferase [Rhizobium leguminosarum]MBB4419033.1 GNAT superfamily N-acetyltransferase [Rhizobium leguminosarum]MBB4433636.1 GNAT superfamily N-acetyltransferase [Rhizobium esperanzae]